MPGTVEATAFWHRVPVRAADEADGTFAPMGPPGLERIVAGDRGRGGRMLELDGLEVLSEEECRRLLTLEHLGRVGVSVGALPAILPVNYVVAGDEILFFTAEGTKLHAATINAVVVFQVDHFNAANRTGWSVMVLGQARERTEPAVANGAISAGLTPWASGDRSHLVALTTEIVSGRRIVPHPGRGGAATTMVAPNARVSALVHRPVRVGADWTLQDAAAAMRSAGVSSALVGQDEAIITERDLTRALMTGLGAGARVGSVSVGDFVTVTADISVIEAAGVMLDYDVRHLVVSNARGDVVGLVSLRDLMRVLVDAMDPAIWVILSRRLSVIADPI